MRRLFFNEEVRLRAGWRLLGQFALNYVGVALFLISLTAAVSGLAPGAAEREPSPYARAAIYAAIALVSTGTVYVLGRFVDKRPFRGFGLRLGLTFLFPK